MKFPLLILLAVATGALGLRAQDLACPAYPASIRTEIEASLDLDRQFSQYSATARRLKFANVAQDSRVAGSGNFIDQFTYKKMAADGVLPAPSTTDAEFLRRVSLDLTGRIPAPEKAAAFLATADAGRRSLLIEELLASPAYADQLTLFLANRFKVTRQYDTISARGRDTF